MFRTYFGIDPITGVLITAGVVLFYTMMGGFLPDQGRRPEDRAFGGTSGRQKEIV